MSCFLLLLILFAVYWLPLPVYAGDTPIDKMQDETISYFKPLTGKITSVEGRKVVVNLGVQDSVKAGMRFNILREEAPFRHPVTKEPLGKLESSVGRLEIKEVSSDSSAGEIIEGEAGEGDKVRISENKVNLFFCQSKGMDWYLADSYYRNLKETGRFNMIDTGSETDDPTIVTEEARRSKADVALLLRSESVESGTLLVQRLFWVSDGMKFSEMKTAVDASYAKDLRFGEEFFTSHKEQALLSIDMPIDAKLMTTADIDGDGKEEIVFSTEKDVRIYILGVDLQPALGGIRIEGSSFDTYLWLDSIDLNKNRRDEIIITSMIGDDIISYIYELKGSEFVLLYKAEAFLRKIGNRLIAQSYSRAEGFEGDVYEILWEGEYKKGGPEKLPKGVNIYDFVYADNPQAGKLLVAYDEDGFINIYDDRNTRIWKSKTNAGGFLTTFKRTTPSGMVDRGEWSVKDRLLPRNNEVLSIKRIPLFGMVRGFGYKKSRIVNLWWNGLSMEENVLIDDVDGTIFDYMVNANKIFVLSSPPLGIKPGNILKGENPIKTELYIYSIKGL